MAAAHSLTRLIRFIRRSDWNDAFEDVLEQHIGRICSGMGIDVEDLFNILGEVAATTLHGCALEDLMSRDFDGHNVVDEYLRRRGYTESPGAKRYMQALRNSVMSLYEVSDVKPGQSFLARDMIRGGDPVQVLEVSATKSLKQWDRIGARLVREGSDWRMSGGVLPYERRASDFLLDTLGRNDGKLPDDLRQETVRRFGAGTAAQIDRDLLETPPLSIFAATFSGIWLTDALERMLGRQQPQLQNTDGHALVMCRSTMPLLKGATAAKVRKALEQQADLTKTGTASFDWVHADAPPTPKPPKTAGIAFASTNSAGQTILGNIATDKTAVVLSTNSRERADTGEAMLMKVLAGLIGTAERIEETADDLRAEAERSGRRRDTAAADEVPPEVARPAIQAYLEQHYRKTLDEPIPALGNVSPREAAKTEAGRKKVAEWLKYLENQSARAGGDPDDPMRNYDFGWMWEELGVANRRR